MVNKGGLSLKLTSFLKLRLYNDSEHCMYLGVIKSLCGVWVVVGGGGVWWWCVDPC